MKKVLLLLITVSIYGTTNAQHEEHSYTDSNKLKKHHHSFHQRNDNNFIENQTFFFFEKEYDEESGLMEKKVEIEPEPNLFFFHYQDSVIRIGMYGSASMEPKDSTSQMLAGLLYRIPLGKGMMEFGLGSGYEFVGRKNHIKSGMPFLISSLIAYEDRMEKLTGLTIGEYGPEGYWYLFSLNYRFGKKPGPFGVGIHLQKDAPSGARFNFYVGKHFTFWALGGFCLERNYAPGIALCVKYNLRFCKA